MFLCACVSVLESVSGAQTEAERDCECHSVSGCSSLKQSFLSYARHDGKDERQQVIAVGGAAV